MAGIEGAAELRLSQGVPSAAAAAAAAADPTAEGGGVKTSEEDLVAAAAGAPADSSASASPDLALNHRDHRVHPAPRLSSAKAADQEGSDMVAEEGAATGGGRNDGGGIDGIEGMGPEKGVLPFSTLTPTASRSDRSQAAAPSSAPPDPVAEEGAAGGDGSHVTLHVDDQSVLPSPHDSMTMTGCNDSTLGLADPNPSGFNDLMTGFTPRAAPSANPPTPGAYRVGISTGEGRPEPPMSNDDDGNETETETDTAMTAMTTATLVQDGAVADATAVDVEAERAEKDRLQREIEELRRRVAKDKHGSGNTETKEGSPLPWSGKSSRQCRIYAAVAVVCAVAAAGIIGGVLGARGRSEGGSDAGTSGANSSGSSDAFDDGKDNSSPDTGKENSSADAAAVARLEAMKAIVAPMSKEDAFDDEEGPHFAALDWIANADAAQVPADDPEIEWRVRQRYILALFYFSTGGDEWDEECDFLSSDDECKWFKAVDNSGTTGDTVYPMGVFCNDRGRVEGISLWWNNLSGTLPHELSNLDRLTMITLSGNDLSGPIPSELGQLTNLKKLTLNENCLSGTVPESLSQLANLELAQFQGNKDLTGSLNGFCNDTEYKGNLRYLGANCGTCPNSPSLVQCDCCICCDLVTYNCCDREGNRLWNHANIGLNAAGQPSSFDKPCLSEDTLAYYLDHKDDLSWITEGREEDAWN